MPALQFEPDEAAGVGPEDIDFGEFDGMPASVGASRMSLDPEDFRMAFGRAGD
jgi:hypothetical protein